MEQEATNSGAPDLPRNPPAAPSGFSFRPGPGTAIFGGMCMAIFSIWATGGDPAPGEHKLEVLVVRVLMTLLALSLHEWAHGAVAYLLGDTTARDQGRLTLDPRSHFDPVGLMIFPGLLTAIGSPATIGWAKPVPVDFSRLRFPRWGVALVAAAGPASNIMAAISCASLLHVLGINGASSLAGSIAWTFVLTNFCIGAFNLIPLYPMDGGRIASCFLPARARVWLSRNEGRAVILTMAILLVVPLVCMLTGFGASALEPVANLLGRVSYILTWSGDGSWYGPMHAWTSGR